MFRRCPRNLKRRENVENVFLLCPCPSGVVLFLFRLHLEDLSPAILSTAGTGSIGLHGLAAVRTRRRLRGRKSSEELGLAVVRARMRNSSFWSCHRHPSLVVPFKRFAYSFRSRSAANRGSISSSLQPQSPSFLLCPQM